MARTLSSLFSDPSFISAGSEIREDMFSNWLNNDFQELASDKSPAQKINLENAARQYYQAVSPPPEKAGLLRSSGDLATNIGAGAIYGIGSIFRALSPENPIGTDLQYGSQKLKNYLLSEQEKEQQLSAAQRLQAANGLGETLSAFGQNAYRHPLSTLSNVAGPAIPIAVTTVLTDGAAAIPLAAAQGVGETRGQRYDIAHSIPDEQLNQIPEAKDLAAKGYSNQQIRDQLGNEIGIPEVLSALGNTVVPLNVGRSLSRPASRWLANLGESAVLGAAGGAAGGAGEGLVNQEFDPSVNWAKNATIGAASGLLTNVAIAGAVRPRNEIRNPSKENSSTITPNSESSVTSAARPQETKNPVSPNEYLAALTRGDTVEPYLDLVIRDNPQTSPFDIINNAYTGLISAGQELSNLDRSRSIPSNEAAAIRQRITTERSDIEKNTIDNLTQKAFLNVNNSLDPTEVSKYLLNDFNKLHRQLRRSISKGGYLEQRLANIGTALGDDGVNNLIQNVKEALNDTAVTRNIPDDNLTIRQPAETSVSSSDNTGNITGDNTTPISDQSIDTGRNSQAASSTSSAPQADDVQRSGRTTANAFRPEDGSTIETGTGQERGAPGDDTRTIPASTEQSPTITDNGTTPTASSGRDINTTTTSSRDSEGSTTASDKISLTKQTKEVIDTNIKNLSPHQQRTLESAAKANKFSTTQEFIVESHNSRVGDRSLWNTLSISVKKAVDRVLKGAIVALTALGIYHARPSNVEAAYLTPPPITQTADVGRLSTRNDDNGNGSGAPIDVAAILPLGGILRRRRNNDTGSPDDGSTASTETLVPQEPNVPTETSSLGTEVSDETSTLGAEGSEVNSGTEVPAVPNDEVPTSDNASTRSIRNQNDFWGRLNELPTTDENMTAPQAAANLGEGIENSLKTTRQIDRWAEKTLNLTNSKRRVKEFAEAENLMSQNVLPNKDNSSVFRNAMDKVVTSLYDSYRPLIKAFNSSTTLDNNLTLSLNRYHLQGNEVRAEVENILIRLPQLAREFKNNVAVVTNQFQVYTRAMATKDMNAYQLAKTTERLADLNNRIVELKKDVDLGIPNSEFNLAEAESEAYQASKWIKDYNRYINVVRSPDSEASKIKFVGGLTNAEASVLIDHAKKFPYIESFESLRQDLMGIIPRALNYAVENGALSRKEADELNNAGYYVPTSLELPSVSPRDYKREGQTDLSTIPATDAILAKALSFYRRGAFHYFDNEILNTGAEYGFKIREIPDDYPPIGQAIVVRAETNKDGETVTKRYAISNDDNPEAMAALTGMNVKAQANIALTSIRRWTSTFSWWAFHSIPASAPTSSFRELGERLTNIFSQYPDLNVNKWQATIATYKNFPQAVKDSWPVVNAKMNGRDIPDSPIAREINDLSEKGGIVTRNSVLNRQMHENLTGVPALTKYTGGIRRLNKLLNIWNETWATGAVVALNRSLRAQGLDPNVAMTVTARAMDLNRRGTITPFMSALYPFFSPKMAGASNVFKNLSTSTGLKIFLAQVVAASLWDEMLATMAGGDTDEAGNNQYDSLGLNYIGRSLALPLGNGSFGRVPIPYGSASIAYNLGVAVNKVRRGVVTPQEGAEHSLQAFIDETIPAGSPPPASPASDTSFYFVKTFTPEILRRFVNIASNKNDFGTTLNKYDIDPTVPRYRQSRQSTEQFWKDAAKFISPLKDMTPEETRELAAWIIPPISGMVNAMTNAEATNGNPILSAAGQLAGANRFYFTPKNPINNVYFPALERVQNLMKSKVAQYGDVPTKEQTGIRNLNERRMLWLSRTPLTKEERQKIEALFENETLRGKSGKNKVPDDVIKRTFLKKVGNGT